MSDRDLQQLRQVLRQAVDASRMPVREMERRLGVGHGSLYRMLDGGLDLRVRHLLALAGLLGVPPADFLELGCPDAARGAKRRLADWIGPTPQTPAAGPTAASLSLDTLKDLIRETAREEIEKREAETGSKTRRSRR
jgi:transcriptional regulator with XRE-family HTH domain